MIAVISAFLVAVYKPLTQQLLTTDPDILLYMQQCSLDKGESCEMLCCDVSKRHTNQVKQRKNSRTTKMF